MTRVNFSIGKENEDFNNQAKNLSVRSAAEMNQRFPYI
jgi:hypothetical protein